MYKRNERLLLDPMTTLTHADGTWTLRGTDSLNLGLTAAPLLGGIEFDKVDGAANTVYAGIFRTAVIDLSGCDAEDRLVWLANAKAQTNLVSTWLRLGTSAANYVHWSFLVASMTAGRFNLCSVPIGNGVPAGAGVSDWSALTYISAGFEFAAEGNALADIIIGQISVRAAFFSQT